MAKWRAHRTAWETVPEMDRFNRAGEKGQGAVALVLDLAKAFERAFHLCGLVRRTSSFQGRFCGRCLQCEVCVAEPLQTITAMLPWSKWSCLLHSIVLQDALCEVTKISPPLKLRVFVNNLEDEEERSTMATLALSGRFLTGKMGKDQQKARRKQI